MSRKWKKFQKYFHNADCQIHTLYTDGRSTPEEYFKQAEINGLDFILFSEHVRKVTTYDYLKFKEHVYKAGAKSSVKFAVGAEAKVLNELGDIDISYEIALEAEMVLFSFHTPDFKTVESYKRAIANAAKNTLSDVFAHPTFYSKWQKLLVTVAQWEEILLSLREAKVCYEFNKKYDPPDQFEIAALKMVSGLQFIYGSDAHEAQALLSKKEIKAFHTLLT